MSLDFCCNIQMAGSEFGVKTWKALVPTSRRAPRQPGMALCVYIYDYIICPITFGPLKMKGLCIKIVVIPKHFM